MPFAPWTDKAAEDEAVREAIAVLEHALGRCQDEDMRTEAVMAALDYLAARAAKDWPIVNFRKALDFTDPIGRSQNVNASLNGIKRQFNL